MWTIILMSLFILSAVLITERYETKKERERDKWTGMHNDSEW